MICAFTEDRLGELLEGVESVRRQSLPAAETIVVIDHNEPLRRRVAEAVSGSVQVIPNDDVPGNAAARNVALRRAHGELVAFLDDDARADPGWLAAIASALADPRVIGVGGWVEPLWEDREPAWLPAEFYWTISCSYRGLPSGTQPIRNPIGTNMAFRRAALEAVGGFRPEAQRVGTFPVGHEETDLAVRLGEHFPGSIIAHAPQARVDHAVSRRRATLSYFVERTWAEGLTKAVFADDLGSRALEVELSYALRVLPRGIWRGLRDALRGDPHGLARAAAIVVGLATTASGYLWGRLGLVRRSR